ncbi:protein C19orf12 homolog [Bombus pascuorum]|uniref:protein C19orf12 homolog n=1 Tax=Bombus pascuorum TaxID=65598 RepID=UPI002145543C|nr:protein C19orf12 homolog [Bombus pascuorum]XP_060827586.1 protein C19orf12 homolog [Bombus pascuorum]XP_060827587.1 protein C19orf12 homolog [Bombus pascuorum]
MDFPTDELLKEVLQYPAVQDMKVTAKSCGKYAIIVGGSTFLGGIIAGPVGLAVGGIVSSIISAAVGSNEFKSVPYIILYETTSVQREKLALLIVKFLNSRCIWTLRDLLCFNKEELALGIIPIIVKFLTDDMHYSIAS